MDYDTSEEGEYYDHELWKQFFNLSSSDNDSHVIKENSYQVAESFIDKICPPTIIFVVLSGNVLAMKVFLRDFRLLPSLGYLMITFLFDLYFIVTESINDWYIALYG